MNELGKLIPNLLKGNNEEIWKKCVCISGETQTPEEEIVIQSDDVPHCANWKPGLQSPNMQVTKPVIQNNDFFLIQNEDITKASGRMNPFEDKKTNEKVYPKCEIKKLEIIPTDQDIRKAAEVVQPWKPSNPTHQQQRTPQHPKRDNIKPLELDIKVSPTKPVFSHYHIPKAKKNMHLNRTTHKHL